MDFLASTSNYVLEMTIYKKVTKVSFAYS